ncbi:hypothetical protein NEUTE2DRAFT_53678, partial [Neurospora tetrasperma FGSC 2509]
EVNKINLYRLNINYKVEIKKDKNGKEIPLPYSLFYNIFQKEFLVLKKILKDPLNKGFIRANHCLTVVPVVRDLRGIHAGRP